MAAAAAAAKDATATSVNAAKDASIPRRAVRRFRRAGICVLRGWLDEEEVKLLRRECDAVVGGHQRRHAHATSTSALDPDVDGGSSTATGCVFEPLSEWYSQRALYAAPATFADSARTDTSDSTGRAYAEADASLAPQAATAATVTFGAALSEASDASDDLDDGGYTRARAAALSAYGCSSGDSAAVAALVAGKRFRDMAGVFLSMTGDNLTDAATGADAARLEAQARTYAQTQTAAHATSGASADGSARSVRTRDGLRVSLINEQYICKPPLGSAGAAAEKATTFAWHRDGQYLAHGDGDGDADADTKAQQPYVSVWIALDEASEDNGCLRVLPAAEAPDTPRAYATLPAPAGSAADDATMAGVPVLVNPGDAVVMSFEALHCSGPNLSSQWRRAFMPQFGVDAIS